MLCYESREKEGLGASITSVAKLRGGKGEGKGGWSKTGLLLQQSATNSLTPVY